jgi:hypothetical protein
MIAGDAHLVAADDGSNNDYSDNGGAGFPLFQSAPMDNYGSDKARNRFMLGLIIPLNWVDPLEIECRVTMRVCLSSRLSLGVIILLILFKAVCVNALLSHQSKIGRIISLTCSGMLIVLGYLLFGLRRAPGRTAWACMATNGGLAITIRFLIFMMMVVRDCRRVPAFWTH